ncbi:FAD/NAD(P)-binding domain-containing protein [Mollisia scopiformis]|uniref:FAD/NAD(P)-binding domain-containing protein n=1 Tax=Mollisia scopiformis TaxID=149040 RepID=A0A194X2I6_MOLSC|nr:FAD/NAD(P)-binding domain-containing protein [Mollisia scopiformis]KUJ14224.1 FAD/NAD(P)-binding domain-containing protein [Mollisia scopiformis]
MPDTKIDSPKEVLIIGAGVVGLTLAQGCREAGIPFRIFEQHELSSERSQGWSLTLHWSIASLERTIGPQLSALLPQTNVDSSIKEGEGGFLFLNAATCEPKYHVYPTRRFLRAGRQKLRTVLTSGLDIQYGKKLESFSTKGTEVTARFADGTSVTGGLLIGADGNNSVVRAGLKMENTKLTPLPVNLIGAVRHFTPEQAAPVRALNPLLFFALQPYTKTFLFYSIQEVLADPDGRNSYDALVGVTWMVNDAEKDAIPNTSPERVVEMKKRAQCFAEPLLSMIMDIPDDSMSTTGLRLADFPCEPWDNQNGVVTLAGDSAHAMTMFRGEGANHGILDAALLVDQLKKVYSGEIGQIAGLQAYEAEMQERTHAAVLKSRQAAFDGHDWDAIIDTSPLIGGRFPPTTA